MQHFLVPSHVTSFFVPATGSAEQGVGTLHIPPSLFRLGKKHLPDECTKPTVNLLRKWFHTELMRLTRTESKLLSLMKVVADDPRLAKELVRNVIGTTVPWPGRLALDPVKIAASTLLPLPWEMEQSDEETAADNDADDPSQPELELDSWEAGVFFGVPEPLQAITDATQDTEIVNPSLHVLDTEGLSVSAVRVLKRESRHEPDGMPYDEAEDTQAGNRRSLNDTNKEPVDDEAATVTMDTQEPRDGRQKQLDLYDVAVSVVTPPRFDVTATQSTQRRQRQLDLFDVAKRTVDPPSGRSTSVQGSHTQKFFNRLNVDGITRHSADAPSTSVAAAVSIPDVPATVPDTEPDEAALDATQAESTSKKRHRYTDEEKTWILAQQSSHMGQLHDVPVATVPWFKDILTHGVAGSVVSADATAAGLRSIVQRFVHDAETRRLAEQARAQRRERREAKFMRSSQE